MDFKNLLPLGIFFLSFGLTHAQPIPTDTSKVVENNREIIFIKHLGQFPDQFQYEFDNRLLFCNADGVFEHTTEGIQQIDIPDAPDLNYKPYRIVQDPNLNEGFNVIYARPGNDSLLLFGYNIPTEFENDIKGYIELAKTEVYKQDWYVDYSHIYGGNPAYDARSVSAKTSYKNFTIDHTFVGWGDNATYCPNCHISRIRNLTGTITSDTKEITSSCVIQNELIYFNGDLKKIRENSDQPEYVLNNFGARKVANWKDQLVMIGSKMKIGSPTKNVDVTFILEKIFDDLGYNFSLKGDSQGHLWFGNEELAFSIEVILDDKLIDDYEQTLTGNFGEGRYQVSTDTSEFNAQGENFLLVEHKVTDLLINKDIHPTHVMEFDNEVFLGSNIGFLRRQQDGLVPVIDSRPHQLSYYLSPNPQSNLFPFTEYKLVEGSQGVYLKIIKEDMEVEDIIGEEIMHELMSISDGRSFYIENFHSTESIYNGEVYASELFGWGKLDSDYLVLISSSVEAESLTFIYKNDIKSNFKGIEFEQNIFGVLNLLEVDTWYQGEIHSIFDMEIIDDNLAIFPQDRLSHYNYPLSSPHYLSNGVIEPYTFFDEIPISVDTYKDQPIYLYQDRFVIGQPNNWVEFAPSFMNGKYIEQVHITNDNHIWMYSRHGCFELIREEDQQFVSELRRASIINNFEYEIKQSCNEFENSMVEFQFDDSNFAESEYDIYVNRQLITQVSNTSSFTLELANNFESPYVEIYIQNQNDRFSKKSITINNQCVVDQDNDGFYNDVDCDDNNPDINPDAIEILDNDIDENCDGQLLSSVQILTDVKIKVFPNPVSDYINIQLDQSIPLAYKLYSAEGKLLDSQNLNNDVDFKINMKAFPNGAYYLEIIDIKTQSSVTERFIKI